MSGSPIYLDGRLGGRVRLRLELRHRPRGRRHPDRQHAGGAEAAGSPRPCFRALKPLCPSRPSATRANAATTPPKEQLAGLPALRREATSRRFPSLRAGTLERNEAGSCQAPLGLERAVDAGDARRLHRLGRAHARRRARAARSSSRRSRAPDGSAKPWRPEAFEVRRRDRGRACEGRHLDHRGRHRDAHRAGRPRARLRPPDDGGRRDRASRPRPPGAPRAGERAPLLQDRGGGAARSARSCRTASLRSSSTRRSNPARIPVRVKINGVERARPKTEWNASRSRATDILTPTIVFTAIANAVKSTAADAEPTSSFEPGARSESKATAWCRSNERGFSPMGAASATVFSQLRMFGLMEAAFANAFESSRA